jgi:hypothetical protein
MTSKFEPEIAAQYIAATHWTRPDPEQAGRAARVAGSLANTLDVTAAESLFDTEPDQLQATLISLADPEDLVNE